MLSPSHRQVAHALLTRPPLDNGGKPPLSRSTWMCYARRQRSSWARIKLSSVFYYHMLFACHNQTRVSLCFFRVLSLFLTFVCSFRNCRDSSLSRCSIFKDHFTIPAPFFPSSIPLKGASPDSLTILPHLLPFCQPLFKKKFFPFLFRLPPTSTPLSLTFVGGKRILKPVNGIKLTP